MAARGKSTVGYGQPDYESLRCPECGNGLKFVELALRETAQPFLVREGNGAPDWGLFESDHTQGLPLEIRCGDCRERGVDTTVWSAASEGPPPGSFEDFPGPEAP